MSDRETFKKVASDLGYSFVLNESGSYNSPFTESAYLVFLSTLEHCKQGEPVAWRRRVEYKWGQCNQYRDNEMDQFDDHKSGHYCYPKIIGEVEPLFTHAMPKSEPVYLVIDHNTLWRQVGESQFNDTPANQRMLVFTTPQPSTDVSELVPEGYVLLPIEPAHADIRAMSESVAVDDEGQFPPMCDLLDFSGENKTHTVLRAAYKALIAKHTVK